MTEYERCLQIWKNWEYSAPQEIQSRLRHYQMLHAYHAVKVSYPSLNFSCVPALWEGSKLTGYTGELYPLIALNNHKVAFALAEECLKDRESISVELICGFQHALSCGLYTPEAYVEFEDRPGELKHVDQVVGLIDVGASPEDIEEMLQELVDEIPHVADMNDTLVAAAYMQARIIFLKPFTIANEEVSRMVTNYWLRLQGHPPVVIPEDVAGSYRKCLEAFDIQENIEPLALFMCDQVAKYWSNQMAPSEPSKSKPLFTLKL